MALHVVNRNPALGRVNVSALTKKEEFPVSNFKCFICSVQVNYLFLQNTFTNPLWATSSQRYPQFHHTEYRGIHRKVS